MSNDIYYHRYVLKSAATLNARSQKHEIEGSLIRIGAGVGCIHPWVELGDEDLDRQLEALGNAKPHRLGERAMHCAALDGKARESGVSLFDELTIPDSHMTVVPGMELGKRELESFTRIKLKGTMDLDQTKEEAMRCYRLASPECRLRIDFNDTLDHSVAMNLAQALGKDVCERIEFIEDPTRFDTENWSRLSSQIGLSLAVDRECEAAVVDAADLEWWIIKPALVNPEMLRLKLEAGEGVRNLVVTSYMDHAIGQMYAAYEAALLKTKCPELVRACGLLTHELFERNDFFEAIKSKGPKLMSPGGTGLGFDEQLDRLPWKKLGN